MYMSVRHAAAGTGRRKDAKTLEVVSTRGSTDREMHTAHKSVRPLRQHCLVCCGVMYAGTCLQ